MDIRRQDTLDSLNKDISLYKEELNIVEGLLELYKSLFGLQDIYGKDRKFIIDYGVNIIERYKKQWIELFDNLLIFKENIGYLHVVDIKNEDFYYIIHGMEKFFLKEYELFLSSWDLEVATFIEKNGATINIKKYMINQSKEEIRSFNLSNIKSIIDIFREEAKIELGNSIKEFNRSILIEKDDLKYFFINKSSMEITIFYDELNFIREAVLNKIEDIQVEIKRIIEDKLVKRTIEAINQVTEEKIEGIIRRYKEELNRCFISTIDIKEKKLLYDSKNKIIQNEGLYRRCVAVLEVELNYLQFVKSVGTECFRIIEKEGEACLNKVFISEFFSSIHDMRFAGDFKNLIEIYKIKGAFVLENITKGLVKEFIQRYNEIILLMLKNRKHRIQKLYVFKPITYMGSFHIYNPPVIFNLQRLLIEIYEGYDLKDIKSLDVKSLKKAYVGLGGEIENIVDKFNMFLDEIEINENIGESSQEIKIEIYKGITDLRNEIWKLIDSRFITVFNCFNDMVGRGIIQLEKEISLYENSIDYADY